MLGSRRASLLPKIVVVAGFILITPFGFAYLWTQAGGSIPMPGQSDYEVSFQIPDVKNLEERGDVRMAGVDVGEVIERSVEEDGARVTVKIAGDQAPLHEGASVEVKMKGLIGMSYVDIDDGKGEPLPSGATLRASSVEPAVDVDELMATLDEETRDSLSGMVQSLGGATEETGDELSRTMSGLGMLGREGHTALDAIAAQSDDLEALTREAGVLMATLDTGRGRIVDVVENSNRLLSATTQQRESVEKTVRDLPGVLEKAEVATGEFGVLSDALAPVAEDLDAASPSLNDALMELPDITADTRALLPNLDGTLDAAPNTLEAVPAVSEDLRGFVPEARAVLRDVNPMLGYLEPYGTDIGAMFANFGATFDLEQESGIRPVRIASVFNQHSLRNNPAPVNLDTLHWKNPYPGPGMAGDPQPFEGKYPRVERE